MNKIEPNKYDIINATIEQISKSKFTPTKAIYKNEDGEIVELKIINHCIILINIFALTM